MQTTAAKLVNLIRSVVPDLADLPLYLVFASDLAVLSDYIDPSCDAVCGRHLDLELRSHLESRGQWQGRGAAIIARDDVGNGALAGLILHELGHILDASLDLSEPESFSHIERLLEISAAVREFWNQSPTDLPAWFAHEAVWLRNCIHLHARFEAAGMSVPLPLVIPGHYGISSCWKYHAELGDEPKRLERESFATIRNTKPPREFSDLWCRDIRATFLLHSECPPRWAQVCISELEKYTA